MCFFHLKTLHLWISHQILIKWETIKHLMIKKYQNPKFPFFSSVRIYEKTSFICFHGLLHENLINGHKSLEILSPKHPLKVFTSYSVYLLHGDLPKVESITLQLPTHLISCSGTLSRACQNLVSQFQLQQAWPVPAWQRLSKIFPAIAPAAREEKAGCPSLLWFFFFFSPKFTKNYYLILRMGK